MKSKIFVTLAFIFTLIFTTTTAFADYNVTADNTVPAFHDEGLTNRTGNERVDAGDLVTVHQETRNAYYLTYPTPRGSKTRWVPKNVFNWSIQINPFQWNGSYYQVYNTLGVDWGLAKAYCETLNFNGRHGHLVTITSPQEQGLVVTLLRQSSNPKNSYWIGGYREGDSWRWVTGEPFSYSNWGQWQPDGDGTALMMYFSTGNGWPSGVWNDLPADGGTPPFFGTGNIGFICEW